MSMYAYKDEARTENLLARNAQNKIRIFAFTALNPNVMHTCTFVILMEFLRHILLQFLPINT